MANDYIPVQDAQALVWCKTFRDALVASPSAYQVSAAEAAGISSAVEAFDASYHDAVDPAQRTPEMVSLKDSCRNAAIQLCRQYAQTIRQNAGVSNDAKIAIGIRPINPSRTPIHCPVPAPAMNIVAATMGAHTLRFADSVNPANTGKPFGASEIQIWVGIDNEPVMDPGEANFYGKFTKNPISVAFAHDDNGKQATYHARWAGRRGDTGNWSIPITLAIAA